MTSRPLRVAASHAASSSPLQDPVSVGADADATRHHGGRVGAGVRDGRPGPPPTKRRQVRPVGTLAREAIAIEPIAIEPITIEPIAIEPPLPLAPSVTGELVLTAPRHASAWRQVAKRVLDIVGALVGLVLSLPIIAILAPIIRLDSSGGVFFAQTRIGRGGRPFRCYKLRTMCEDAEVVLERDPALRRVYRANDFKVPAAADHRVTPLGRFLRTTSLDELPQFWNVLRGEMSLVGPRPIVAAELVHYGAERATLLSMRPGLTGAWAVRGRSRIGYPERAAIELDYVRTWSLREDLVILARTVSVVLQRRGAY